MKMEYMLKSDFAELTHELFGIALESRGFATRNNFDWFKIVDDSVLLSYRVFFLGSKSNARIEIRIGFEPIYCEELRGIGKLDVCERGNDTFFWTDPENVYQLRYPDDLLYSPDGIFMLYHSVYYVNSFRFWDITLMQKALYEGALYIFDRIKSQEDCLKVALDYQALRHKYYYKPSKIPDESDTISDLAKTTGILYDLPGGPEVYAYNNRLDEWIELKGEKDTGYGFMKTEGRVELVKAICNKDKAAVNKVLSSFTKHNINRIRSCTGITVEPKLNFS